MVEQRGAVVGRQFDLHAHGMRREVIGEPMLERRGPREFRRAGNRQHPADGLGAMRGGVQHTQ